jgi:hypothetical protein
MLEFKDVQLELPTDEIEDYTPSVANRRLIKTTNLRRDTVSACTRQTGSSSKAVTSSVWEKSPKQKEAIKLMTLKETIYLLIDGGSRSGKTFISVYAIFVRALKYPNSRHCILRLRYNHAKTSLCRDTIPKVIRVCFPNLINKIEENKTESFFTLPNGSEIWIGGLDDKARVEKILGNEYGTLYFNECSQIGYDEQEIALTRLAQKIDGMKNLALYDCNPPSIKHWTYRQWYDFTHPETNVPFTEEQKKHYKVLKINPTDNLKNIGEHYLQILKNMSPAKQKRFLEGKYSTGSDGALFTISDLHRYRVKVGEAPDFLHCGIGVDPAATSKKQSDETGIVGGGAAMIDGEWHYYITLDNSLKGRPEEWAAATIKSYNNLLADKVIGETNNGGDMVESTIRAVDHDVSYVGVHASRGKAIRAEPVAALAYRGRLHIVGFLSDLEDEMVSWEPDSSTWSPNRMDAMVWLVTWLMSKTKIHNPRIRNLGA